MTVIFLFFGELKKDRQEKTTFNVVNNQLLAMVCFILTKIHGSNIVLAYEPGLLEREKQLHETGTRNA
jgi:triosephosphate isomerase